MSPFKLRSRILRYPANVTDIELVTLLIGRGYNGMNAFQLAKSIVERAGSLGELLRTIDPANFNHRGVGQTARNVLAGTAELAFRYNRNPRLQGDTAINDNLCSRFTADRTSVTEAEVLSLALGNSSSCRESVQGLITESGGLGELLRTLNRDIIEGSSLTEPERFRLIAFAHVVIRYHNEVYQLSSEAVVELPLSMLSLAEVLVRALAEHPRPQLISKGAELLRLGHEVTRGLARGESVSLPDLDAIRDLIQSSTTEQRNGKISDFQCCQPTEGDT